MGCVVKIHSRVKMLVVGIDALCFLLTGCGGQLTLTSSNLAKQGLALVTWSSPAPITFGTALSSAQLNATASVSGTFNYSPASGSVLGAGVQTLSATFTPVDTSLYSVTTTAVSLQVTQATPAITWATPAAVAYGTALSATQLNATSSVPGTFAYSPAAGAVPAAGTQALTVTFTPTDAKDYNTASATVPLQVTNPIPQISSAAVVSSSASGFNVDIIGTGFVSQSSVGFDGLSAATTFLSSTELEATIPQTAGRGSTVVATVENPSPGAATSNAIEIALPPTSLKQLVGCKNPYVNSSTGSWGASDALYIPINNQTVLIGTPTYITNTIFWTSREAQPGESVLMTGAFTESNKTVKVAFIPAGTVDWQSVVNETGTVVPTTQQGTTGLSFIVPPQFPAGVYGFEIDDSSAPSIFALANEPSIEWAIGIPSITDPNIALQSQVHDCAVEPGQFLRIFGKNFLSSSQVVLESSNGSIVSISPTRIDTNSIVAQVPSSMSPGEYYVWVGSAPWSATSSLAVPITVVLPPSLAVSTVACAALVGDGQTDNTSLLQSCLDNNAPNPIGSQLVYITIPNGVFVLTHSVTIRGGEILIGSSPANTQFLGEPLGPQPNTWFTIPQYAGMANITIEAPNATYLVSGSDLTGNPTTSGHVFLENMRFDSTPAGSNSNSSGMVALSGPDIQIYGSTFLSGTLQNLGIVKGDGVVLSGNTFIDNTGSNYFESNQNIIIEDNSVYSQTGPGSNGAAAFDFSRGFCVDCNPTVTRNEYAGYNTIQNMGAANNQIILTDGGAGAYFGPVASSTWQTVVLADDPSWIWTGTGDLEGVSVAIVLGTGVGQQSFIKSVNGLIITLEKPWKVMPDSTSVVSITASEQNLIIAHNTITNTLGQPIIIARSVDAVIEDNVLTNSGQGIVLWGSGPYGGPEAFAPIMNTDVLRNQIAVGAGSYIISDPGGNDAGIGIFDNEGIMISGLMVRDNVLPTIQTIYSSNGSNGINANVIEDNNAVWAGPKYTIPGFLVQGNVVE